ncbi:MAG: carboxypeptidase regulatory-like domain-containing protein, partial [Bacteroidota bacterium]
MSNWNIYFSLLFLTLLLSACCKEDPVGDILITVVDDLTGEALSDATVDINDLNGSFSDRKLTDAEGRASFLEIDLFEYELRISLAGYESATLIIPLREDQIIDETVRLEREKDPPVLTVSTDRLTFELDENAKTFSITNSGQRTLEWTIQTEDSEGLIESIVPPDGNTLEEETREVTVNLKREGVRGGTYFATLTVQSNGTGTDSKTIDLEIPVFAAETPPTLQTLDYANVGVNAAEIFANLTDLGVNGQEAEVGFVWSSQTEEPVLGDPTTSFLKITDLLVGGNLAYNGFITGLTPETKYYVRAYARNVAGTAYGNTLTLITDLLDSRDNQVYDLLEIGGNIWMQKNLNFATTG